MTAYRKLLSILIALSSMSSIAKADFGFAPPNFNPPAVSNYCVAELRDSAGRIAGVFEDYSCQYALDRCQQDLYFRQRQGFDPYARCVLAPNNPSPQPPQEQVIDEVHFYHHRTARAIQMCEDARARDYRCNDGLNYRCTQCSRVAHSDHSSYLVMLLNQYQQPPQRRLINTFHYNFSQPGMALNVCQNERMRMRECSMTRQFECSPCFQDPYGMHSEFSLYQLY